MQTSKTQNIRETSREFSATNLPEKGLIRVSKILESVDCGRSTWWRWVNDGIAPQPIRIGGSTFWKAHEVRFFLENGFLERDSLNQETTQKG